MKKLSLCLLIIFLCSSREGWANYEKLTQKSYEKAKDEKAILLYSVNWGRQLGCSGFDNAQLQGITFSRIDQASHSLDKENIVFNTPSKLFVDNTFISYAVLVPPGEYALTGFDIKVAKSRQVGHYKPETTQLFENGKAIGGTFKINPGEIVYIGEFGLDCATQQPILWRYYVEKKDFNRFIDDFKKAYKFTGDKPVEYRLFQTDKFGL